MIDFKDIIYLKKGTRVQKSAYRCLKSLNVFETLKQFDPILTGSIPIKLNTLNSDLDIICNVTDFELFRQTVFYSYGKFSGFHYIVEMESMTFNFSFRNFKIELFAENKPVFSQNAYIHMLTEYRFLKLACQKFRCDVLNLKKMGMKTEPAFGKLLSLHLPYEQLYQLYFADDRILLNYLKKYAQ